jgi:hypothetical protein
VGSTFICANDRYARTLQVAGNRLMLEGLSERVMVQPASIDLLELIGEENVILGLKQFGASLRQALVAAEE